MARTTILLGLLMALSAPAVAQGSPEGWLIPFAVAFQPDVKGFNAEFAAKGLPEAKARHYGWGIELRSAVSGNILVGPLYFRTWDDIQNADFQLRTDNSGIFGEVGYKFSIGKVLTVVPMLGAGGLTETFTLRERTGELTLDSLLNAPGRIASISPGMRATGLAALEVTLVASTSSGRYGLALRGGYLYAPGQPTWRLANGAEITGIPHNQLGGLFFTAGIVLMPEPQIVSSYP